ncbi:MAG TPA: hypothetical protein VGC76_13930 [Pyrinomonadaceae bacterium]
MISGPVGARAEQYAVGVIRELHHVSVGVACRGVERNRRIDAVKAVVFQARVDAIY